MKTAAIYARVSSDKQREENTIASQTAALVAFACEQQFEVPQEWVFEDDGYRRCYRNLNVCDCWKCLYTELVGLRISL